MWINLARVSPEAFEQLRGDPDLVGPLLVDQDGDVLARLGVAEEDISGLDYESAAQMIEAMNEVDEDAIEVDGEAATGAADAVDDEADEDDDDEDDEDDDDKDDEDDDDHAADADDEDDEADADAVLVDLRVDGELDYDAGFGSAFFLTPGAAKQAAAYSAALGLDDEAKAIVEAAAERGHYVVGVIS